LRSLVRIVIRLDFIRLAIGKKTESTVMAKARRRVVRFAAGQLNRRRTVDGYFPDIANVLCAVAVQPLGFNSKPGPVRRRGNRRDALEFDVIVDGILHRPKL